MVGSYATTATATGAALSNYNVSFVAGAFTITKKAATVTAGSGTKVYGTAVDPALSAATASGFTAADAPAMALSSTRASGEAAGNYATTATATGAALSNYTVAYVAGNFSITKATASVTPNAATKVYGAADPAFTGTLTGFLAADGVTAAYSRTAGESVAGGPYTISATLSPASALANYNVTSNTAAFAITKAALSVTANNASRVYNTPNPALSGTLTGVLAGDGITASYSTTAVTNSVVGSYPIVPALSDPNGKLANYTVTSTNGTLSVTPMVPTVTFVGAPASAVYRSTFTVATSTNSTTAAVITASGACSVSGTTVTMTSGTGACALTASWAADANYTSALATQSTNATKATPVTTTVVSSATSTNYGQLVTLTATINGIAGGAAPSGTATFNDAINGGAPGVLGSATANGSAIYNTFALGAGAHSLTVGYGGDANYVSSSSAAIAVTVIPVGIANLNPVSLNYSSQPVGNASMAMPVTLTNIGVANLAINNLQITGDNTTDFSISSSACGASLAPGASCVVNVKFKPTATGTRTASLVFTDNDNGIAGSTQPISLVGSSLSNSKANFTPKAIGGGKSLWFASELTLAKGPHDANNVFLDMINHPVRVFVTNGVIGFTANGINYSLPVPDALITFSPTATTASTTFDAATNRWLTTIPTVHPTTKQQQFDDPRSNLRQRRDDAGAGRRPAAADQGRDLVGGLHDRHAGHAGCSGSGARRVYSSLQRELQPAAGEAGGLPHARRGRSTQRRSGRHARRRSSSASTRAAAARRTTRTTSRATRRRTWRSCRTSRRRPSRRSCRVPGFQGAGTTSAPVIGDHREQPPDVAVDRLESERDDASTSRWSAAEATVLG